MSAKMKASFRKHPDELFEDDETRRQICRQGQGSTELLYIVKERLLVICFFLPSFVCSFIPSYFFILEFDLAHHVMVLKKKKR